MNDEKIIVDGIEISDAGRLTEIHRNATVYVLEHENGNVSYGWVRQNDTISEYIIQEGLDDT